MTKALDWEKQRRAQQVAGRPQRDPSMGQMLAKAALLEYQGDNVLLVKLKHYAAGYDWWPTHAQARTIRAVTGTAATVPGLERMPRTRTMRPPRKNPRRGCTTT